jgi:hypothetical protein
MKTIRNTGTLKIERVKDKEADPKVKLGWEYVPKSEWKNLTRKPKSEKNDTPINKKQGKNASK